MPAAVPAPAKLYIWSKKRQYILDNVKPISYDGNGEVSAAMAENERLDVLKNPRWLRVMRFIASGPQADIPRKLTEAMYRTLRSVGKQIPLEDLLRAAAMVTPICPEQYLAADTTSPRCSSGWRPSRSLMGRPRFPSVLWTPSSIATLTRSPSG
jgi:hypothetical protein